MRFELVPEFPNDKPYPTATCEIDYQDAWVWVPDGTDAEMLATAKRLRPDGRAFQIVQSTGKKWSKTTMVKYEQPHHRWFVELATIEELLAVIEAMSGCVYVQGNVISEHVE